MASITIFSDFGAPQNKLWHYFPIYFMSCQISPETLKVDQNFLYDLFQNSIAFYLN